MSTPENGWRINAESDNSGLRSWIKILAPAVAAALLTGMGWVAVESYNHLQTTAKLVVTVEKIEKHLDTIEDAIIRKGLR